MIPLELITLNSISLGSNVATDKAKIITSAYKKAIVGFSKTQEFKIDSIIPF